MLLSGITARHRLPPHIIIPAPLVKMFQALLLCVFKVPSHSVPINRTRGVCLLNKRENIIRERAGDRECEAGYMLLSLSSDSLCLSVSPLRRTKHSFVVRFQRLGHWAKGTDSVSAPKIRRFSSETSAGGGDQRRTCSVRTVLGCLPSRVHTEKMVPGKQVQKEESPHCPHSPVPCVCLF